MVAVTRERIIWGQATPEVVWQHWLEQADVPPWRWREVITSAVRLVVLAPHPDDEVLACGGLLAMHAQAGGQCLIVGITDGEASHTGSPLSSRRALAAARTDERRQGLARLGLRDAGVIRLGIADGCVNRYPEVLVGMLTALLRSDDVVIGAWRLDGHPDHDMAGDCAARVCRNLGCRLVEAPIWMWHWAAPQDQRVPWQRLRRVKPGPGALQKKQAALSAHASQLAPRGTGLGPVLDDAMVVRSRRDSEYFFL